MKKGYWLVALFALWCLMCALWYMFGVKGLPEDPASFSPQPPLLAIIEILTMLVGAFIIGFGLAWLMRETPIILLNEALRAKQSEAVGYMQAAQELSNENEVSAKRLEQSEERISTLAQEVAERKGFADAQSKKVEELERKAKELEVKNQHLDGEGSSTRFRLRLLENELSERDSTIGTLSEQLAELASKPRVEHRDWSDHPFVRPVEADPEEKDDLTMIKGIGATFQRKLNSLDIHSFRQISEMSGEAVARLAEAIEVFPDRIHRDNWIGQATKLYQKKLEDNGMALPG